MFRRCERKNNHHTKPDHRPMIPEFRAPQDPIDLAVRDVRRRYHEINPDQKEKWR